MPAIWSSSERPISVRTIWVDGIRHAILSPDDPLIDSKSRRRSRVPRKKSYSMDYQQLESRLDRLNSCFTNLHMVVNNDLSDTKTLSPMYRKLSAPVCPRLLTDTSDTTTLGSILGENRKIQKKHQEHKTTKQDTNLLICERDFQNDIYERGTSKSETDFKTNTTECKSVEGTSDTFWNPLFERVHQWLDLSGRAQSTNFEDDFARRSPHKGEQKWSPVKRRLPRLKRDSLEENDRVMVKNYKLHGERNAECLKREESRTFQRRLSKLKNTREEFQEGNQTTVDLSSCTLDTAKDTLISDEESKNEVKGRISSSMWSPPGRRKLHIVIPNLISKENHASSQESLIND